MSKIRVLLVDDEELFRKPMTRWLEKKGYHVDAFANGDDAIEQVRSVNGKYDVALIDQVLVEGRD
ncbi:MAG: response regulator, partial [Calditrichaeota bacterium]|nr:response regulator [Calditrichota bacterium]